MAQAKTHYDVLGLSRDASVADIEANYRLKLSQLKGRAGVSAADVMALRVAHQALADPVRRAAYDKSLAPPRRARETFAATDPKAEGPDRAWWQGTPALVAGLAVMIGIGAWGWSHWQKKAVPPPRVAARPAVATPAAPKPARAPASPAVLAAPVASTSSAPPAGSVAQRVLASASAGVVRLHVHDAVGGMLQQGSGVVVDGGRVATSCELLKGGARFEIYRGAVIGGGAVAAGDEAIDLCAIQTTSSVFKPGPAALGNAYGLKAGQRVYAVGVPKGQPHAVAEGVVAALPDTPEGPMIKLKAPIPPGFRGGGLYDGDGKLLGIVTLTSRDGDGAGLAVPADRIAGLRPRPGTASPGVAATKSSSASSAERAGAPRK